MLRKKESFITKNIYPLGLSLLIFICAVLYLGTTARFHVPIGDSDELATVGYFLGLAHPPGYALYSLFIFVFTHLVPFGSLYFRASLTSLIFSLFTIAFLYITSLRVSRDIDHDYDKNRFVFVVFGIVSSLIISFSFSFWLYSIVPEVFALNNLFVVIISYSLLLFYMSKGQDRNALIVSGFVYGLGILHLQTIILTIPASLFIVFYTFWKNKTEVKDIFYLILYSVLMFLTGAAFSTLLVWLINLKTLPVSWNFPETFAGLWSFITRSQYASGPAVSAYAGSGANVNIFYSLKGYFEGLITDFSFFPLVMVIPGLFYLWNKSKALLIYFLLAWVFTGPFFIVYAGFPTLTGSTTIVNSFVQIATISRQFIMSELFVYFFIFFGFVGVWEFIYAILENKDSKAKNYFSTRSGQSFITTLVISIVLIVVVIFTNFSQVNLSKFNYMQKISIDMLNDATKGSVLICFSDITCDSLLYQQQVNNTRKDITLVPFYYSIRKKYLDNLNGIQRFNYPFNPNNIEDIVSWSKYNRKRVFVADISSEYITYLGADGKAFFLVPDEYLHELTDTIPLQAQSFAYLSSKALTSYIDSIGGVSSKNLYFLTFYGYMPRAIGLNAYFYWYEGFPGEALKALSQQFEINAAIIPQQEYQISKAYYQKNNPSFGPGDTTKPSGYYYTKAQGENATSAIKDLTYSLLIDPTNVPARLLLAGEYAKFNKQLAMVEYENVIKLDPKNKDANAALKTL